MKEFNGRLMLSILPCHPHKKFVRLETLPYTTRYCHSKDGELPSYHPTQSAHVRSEIVQLYTTTVKPFLTDLLRSGQYQYNCQTLRHELKLSMV